MESMNKLKIGWVLIAVIGLLCIGFVLYTWHLKAGAVSEYRELINQWNRNLASLKIVPTPENIFILQREYEWVVNKDKELKGLLLKRQLQKKELSPLQFKEELLDMQTKLKQLADIQGCKLEEDIGFSEYAVGEIPSKNEVALLYKQLLVINKLVNLLLKHKVAEIGPIRRLPGVYHGERNLYREIVFKINIQCVLEDLLGVLADMVNVPYMLVVRSLSIDKLDGNKVNVELLIGAVEFTFA